MKSTTDSLRQQIHNSMDLKDTEELIEIWKAQDNDEWTDDAIDVVEEILRDRNVNISSLELQDCIPDKGEKEMEVKQFPSINLKPDISNHLALALTYMNKRKFKEALQESNSAIEAAPGLTLAHSLQRMIQEKKDLYGRGLGSIIFGFLLLNYLTSATSTGRRELTNLGTIALGLGAFLVIEGFFVALSGMRSGFLVDGIAVCIVGLWNLGMSLSGNGNFFFAGLGIAQLVWGAMGITKYSREAELDYSEIEDQIPEFVEFEDSHAKKVSAETQRKLDKAYKAYEGGQSRKNLLPICDSILQVEPNWALAHNLRGMLLEDLWRPEEAIMAYREALRLDPSFHVAQENLSDLENRIQKKSSAGGSPVSTYEWTYFEHKPSGVCLPHPKNWVASEQSGKIIIHETNPRMIGGVILEIAMTLVLLETSSSPLAGADDMTICKRWMQTMLENASGTKDWSEEGKITSGQSAIWFGYRFRKAGTDLKAICVAAHKRGSLYHLDVTGRADLIDDRIDEWKSIVHGVEIRK